MVAFLMPAPFIKTGFRPNAVTFDGTNDYLTRGAGLTGASDNSGGTFHCWFKTSSGSTYFLTDASFRCYFAMQSNGALEFGVKSATTTYTFTSTASNFDDGAWRSLLVSWDMNFSAGNKIMRVYVDDVVVPGSVSDAGSAFSVDYTSTNWAVGSNTSGSSKFNGSMSQVWFQQGTYIDLSVEANRRLFITSANRPVFLGSDGSLPGAGVPLIFLDNPAASFGINKGSGGDFTLTGSLTDVTGPGG